MEDFEKKLINSEKLEKLIIKKYKSISKIKISKIDDFITKNKEVLD